MRAGTGAGQGWCAHPPIFLLSLCLRISKLIHWSPTGTNTTLDKDKSKPTVSQGDQQVQASQGRREKGPPQGALGTWGRLMLSGGALSPQGLSGQDKELVMGLGHLNDSYNFSVSVCEHL